MLTARKPPNERFVLVNHLEEWLDINGQVIPLSTSLDPGAVYPAGYEHGIEFSTDPWPTWTFDCNGITVQREILSIQDRDVVIVRWKLVSKKHSRVMLRVRPKFTGVTIMGRITRMDTSQWRFRSGVEWLRGVRTPICLWCGRFTQ